MDIFEELRSLLEALRRAKIDYALCGGMALAAYGIIRATEDIDVMLELNSMGLLTEVAGSLGFKEFGKPLILHNGDVVIHRYVKVFPTTDEHLLLDVLLVSDETRSAWTSRIDVESEFGMISVISRSGMIQLKRLRASGQDLEDIQKLESSELGESQK